MKDRMWKRVLISTIICAIAKLVISDTFFCGYFAGVASLAIQLLIWPKNTIKS